MPLRQCEQNRADSAFRGPGTSGYLKADPLRNVVQQDGRPIGLGFFQPADAIDKLINQIPADPIAAWETCTGWRRVPRRLAEFKPKIGREHRRVFGRRIVDAGTPIKRSILCPRLNRPWRSIASTTRDRFDDCVFREVFQTLNWTAFARANV